MDVAQATITHSHWKARLRTAAVTGARIDVTEVAADDRCALGQWLRHSARPLYGNSDGYQECVDAHAAFHAEAAKIATLINARDSEAALLLLDAEHSSYNAASERLLEALRQL